MSWFSEDYAHSYEPSPAVVTVQPEGATGTAKVVEKLHGNLWTFKDAPKPPRVILKATLKQKSYWEMVKETISPRDITRKLLLRKIESQKQKVLEDAFKRGRLTQDDVDFLNKCMREETREVFEDFQKKIQELVRIEAGEDSRTAMAKIKILKATINWLEELIDWLHGKITAILSKVEVHGPDWCIQQAEELFQGLYAQFSKPDPELEADIAEGVDTAEQGVEATELEQKVKITESEQKVKAQQEVD